MVSFVCDACQETIKKPKLDQHYQRCRGASFSCIDCSTSFQGTNYRSHFSCISEAEKYQKSLYQKPEKRKLDHQIASNHNDKNNKESENNVKKDLNISMMLQQVIGRNVVSLKDLRNNLAKKIVAENFASSRKKAKKIVDSNIQFSIKNGSISVATAAKLD